MYVYYIVTLSPTLDRTVRELVDERHSVVFVLELFANCFTNERFAASRQEYRLVRSNSLLTEVETHLFAANETLSFGSRATRIFSFSFNINIVTLTLSMKRQINRKKLRGKKRSGRLS